MRLAVTFAFTCVGAVAACDGGASAGGDFAWTTSVDSTGDTVRVRIIGEVPSASVRTLVPELEVGALDGSAMETFGDITGLLGTPDGGLVVLDGQVPVIRMFDSNGQYVRDIGAKGGGPGEYEFVSGMARLPDGRLAVWDAAGMRVNVHAPSGDFLTSWRVDFQRWGQQLLTSDRDGFLYADAGLGRDPADPSRRIDGFVRLDSTGRVVDSIPVVHWKDDPTPARARTKDGGSSMTYSIPYGPRNRTRVSPAGGVVSGYGDEYVFYILPRTGKAIRVEREYAPVAVSATEARDYKALIAFRMRSVDPAWSWGALDLPTSKAPYGAISVGLDGRVWIRVATNGVPLPAADLAAPGPGEPPPLTTREPLVYDVHAPSGRLLGRVRVPDGLILMAMADDHVWGVRTGSLGVEYAVRMRVQPGWHSAP